MFARVCRMTPHIIPLDLLILILFCEERARQVTIKNLIFIWMQTATELLTGAFGNRIVSCTQEMELLTWLKDEKVFFKKEGIKYLTYKYELSNESTN